jgi:hypothetical protein
MSLFVVVSGVCVITQESIDLATQTPLTTTNNYIHYITQESIDLVTQTPLTTTNNYIHYSVCVARSIDSCIM